MSISNGRASEIFRLRGATKELRCFHLAAVVVSVLLASVACVYAGDVRSRAVTNHAHASPALDGANIVIPLPPGYVPPPRAPAAAPPSPARETGPTPAATPQARSGVVEIEPDRHGQYQTDVEIDGTTVRALVDTGATFVALTAEDARHLDVAPPPSAFHILARTANGTAKVAHIRLREISIGDITVYDIDAVVAQPGALHVSLLGMSFLRKLESFQVDGGRLVMKQ